ncbi:hypothetical protein OHA40_01870 [Nocardia sp. NBC_00508]|uniref:hypothetical protein n=1 Tax=Nocardia sp. NBC_00508 TaxID=2975992 RepID=UPI002E80BA08|nr:hypothetical protein [Nocardia sp. NBC_00508]WUD66942.1 hypothetical protein OHA40_01870 [Nocardia sp. NBC_00508]
MPSSVHEVLIELVRRRPTLVAELLTSTLGLTLPEFDHARVDSGDLPDIEPTEYRADLVVTLTAATLPVLGIVVEVQLQRDDDKIWSWPVYLTTLRARLRCLVLLVVVCPNERAAGHCRRPITVAPGFTLSPMVLSPANVPVVSDATTASDRPDLAALSAIAHRNNPERDSIFAALAATAHHTADGERYIDLVLAALPKAAARHFLEMLMKTDKSPYYSEFFNQLHADGVAEGEAKGEAKALLRLLRARGFDIPAALASEVAACTDHARLDTWVTRAATANTIDEVFGDPVE